MPGKKFRGKAAIVTLGCAKNQVDSELMAGTLAKYGYVMTPELAEADVAIINTCGFLQASVKESIDRILEVGTYKTKGKLKRVIVAGCMVQRYEAELRAALPEVDIFLGLDQLLHIGDAAAGAQEEAIDALEESRFLYDETMPRLVEGQSAYVKIAEGCDHACSFCLIPSIRGRMRSRPIASVKNEVARLGANGIREVNLIAQDLTAYGKDRGNAEDIKKLLVALDASRSIDWIRLLYAYPVGIDRELLRLISELPSVCEYLDIPLQHSSEKVLKLMGRPLGRFASRPLVEFMRRNAPSVALRTTFIVGFPGETERDVVDLEKFVQEGHFASVGVFCFSREEGTRAHGLTPQVPGREKEQRRKRIMKAQQAVLSKSLERWIGKVLPVLVEGAHEETDLLIASRARFQAPEVDGKVLINDMKAGVKMPKPGSFGEVRITQTAGYDLIGQYEGPLAQEFAP